MNKKLSIILILSIFFSINAFAASYNSSFSNLSVEQNGWCANFDTNFKIYNSSEYPLNKDDDEFNYTLIVSPKIKIYSGPLESMPVLLNSTASASGEFTYKFLEEGDYLFEIIPNGNFNSYSEILEIASCKFSNPSLVTTQNSTPEVKLYNESFLYTDIKVSLIETTNLRSKENITIKNIENLAQNGLNQLQGSTKSFMISGVNSNFSNMDIEVSLLSIEEGKDIKGYFYENNNWVSKEIEVNENKITFKNTKYGIYSITFESKAAPILNEPITTPEIETPITNAVEKESNSNEEDNLETTNLNVNKNTSFNSNLMYYIFGFIGLIGIGLIVFKISKKQKIDKTPMPEVLNSYNEIYSHTKKYVQMYKIQYGKDQIYRALETAKVPRDIIDKIFLEEY